MNRSALIASVLFSLAGALLSSGALAQGVNDPSTPQHNVTIVSPVTPNVAPPTRNVPSTIQAPARRVTPIRPYYGYRARVRRSR